MSVGVLISYFDLFDRKATMDELVDLLKPIPLRHAIHVLSRINLGLRYAMQELGRSNLAEVQGFFLAAHSDDEMLWRLKTRFPFAMCDERPVFLPHGLLNVLRLVVMHCDPKPPIDISVDESVRYAIGRACLMMNDLLLNEAEHEALSAGTEDDRRIALMVQMLAGYEIANPPKAHHVMPRMQVMFRILLKDENVRARISSRCNGFDISLEFAKQVGMTLERWLFVAFSIYAYFLNCGDARDPKPEFMVVNPEKFRGDSGISKEDFEIVLDTIATPMGNLKEVMSAETTDPRYDFVSFRSKPLFIVEEGRVLPADLAFLVEKWHAGVHWTIHDALHQRDRRGQLFNAWGLLFEEYVHWLFKGMKTNLPVNYIPSPLWRNTGDESFDGVFLRDTLLMPLEYKGGFLAREARCSGSAVAFLNQLNKKFTPGCYQLADKIGALFAENPAKRRRLEGMTLDQVETILPVLVLQDHIFRVPFLNWYMNQRFQERLAPLKLRPEVIVRPLTIIQIHDLESVMHAIEHDDFDFISAINDRITMDTLGLSDIMDWFRQYEEFGHGPSPRLKEIVEDVSRDSFSYLFPGHSPE
jgi:hypothetical protein